MRSTVVSASIVLAVAAAASGGTVAFPGNPADMYITSDTANEVYQYERTSPWNYVPGTFAGIAKPQVFSNQSQVAPNVGLYLGAVAGANQDFWLGAFGGLTRISSTTGAFVQNVAGGLRLGPALAPNGNVVVGGPTGTEEFDSATGGFVRTVSSFGDGYNLHCFDGDLMYVVQWGFSATTIKQFSFTTGFPAGPDIAVPFAPQEVAIGPDGALYASGLYNGAAYEGVLRWNGSAWNMFADANANGNQGTGPHGFAWDPVSLDLYMAYQTGEIERFNGLTGQYLNRIDTINTKLTDILFTTVIPAPATAGLLALAGLGALRRRLR